MQMKSTFLLTHRRRRSKRGEGGPFLCRKAVDRPCVANGSGTETDERTRQVQDTHYHGCQRLLLLLFARN